MCFFRNSLPVAILVFFFFAVGLSACKVGEDDPFLSLRSRNARLKANWKLGKMENIYEVREISAGLPPQVTRIQATFNGYDVFLRTYVNDFQVNDTTYGYNYLMQIKETGKMSYENTLIQNLIGVKSTGEDNWYWLDTDKKKSRLYVGAALQFPASSGLNQTAFGDAFSANTLFTDFTVNSLRKKELQLTYDKTIEKVTATGFQQVKVSCKLDFNAK